MAKLNTSESESRKFYSPTEAGKRFGVGPWTIRRWEAKGLLKGKRINQRVVLYSEEELSSLIEQAK